MESIKNLGHIQIFQFADETHLTHQKVTQIVQVIRPTFNPGSLHALDTSEIVIQSAWLLWYK